MGDNGFVKVANKSDIPVSQMKEVKLDGHNICVANIAGKYFAIDNICSHEGGPLADGKLVGYEVECPWHQSKFDMRTGEVRAPPAVEPQAIYQVKVEGDDILVSVMSQAQDNEEESKSLEYRLVLQEKQKLEGTDVCTFRLSKLEEGEGKTVQYLAGQFAFLDIGSVYNDPKGPIRHFTLASSPTEDFILISTRIRDSPYKKRLDSMQIGATATLRAPQGKFTLHEDDSKPAVFLSGGIGVTPFRSMLKYATDKNLSIRIIMFDSNKNQQNILFKRDFENWAKINKNLKIIFTITEQEQDDNVASNWKGEKGRIDMAMLKRHLESEDIEKSVFYICGPPAMVTAMRDILQQNLQIPLERIKVEEFTGY